MVKNNTCLHDSNSPLLIGKLKKEDKITEREMKSYIPKPHISDQIGLFI